jgi:hypothetical protein
VLQCAIYGNFSAPKAQELVVSRGRSLELLRPNDNAKLVTILATEAFGCIRSLAAYRLTGAQRDHIIIGSDSGRIVIVEYNKDKNQFVKIHQETFGRSGCRRIVPGQYIACDPKGRACMIAALEKQKFVYVLSRDAAANLTISSPLEAHKSHNITFSVTALDCGFDNPIFAAIELDYSDTDQVCQGTQQPRALGRGLLSAQQQATAAAAVVAGICRQHQPTQAVPPWPQLTGASAAPSVSGSRSSRTPLSLYGSRSTRSWQHGLSHHCALHTQLHRPHAFH